MKKLSLIIVFLAMCISMSAGIRAGVARRKITPEMPFWLSGYASRTRPATEVLQDLWAKVLVIEENKDSKVIIVTMDIIGLSHQLSESISQRIVSKFGIDRSQLLLNTSHNHSGPVIWPSLSLMYDLGTDDVKAMIRYNKRLADDIIAIIDEAFNDLQPANLSVSHTSAEIAVNRRQAATEGVVIGVNSSGPVDNDVPVLKITAPDGKIRAVLFGYACHNTTLDIYEVNGDYAGFAQAAIEEANPGITAMFVAGCGADQNPNPRRTVELAVIHGNELSNAVQKALAGGFKPVRPPIRTYFTTTTLRFDALTADRLAEEILGDNKYMQRRAGFIMQAMDKGYDVSSISYPVQAIRFSKDFTILALGGEVVVDYSLKAKARYPGENLFVSGYSTEVQCYIPSLRVLKEGGYEPQTSMIYYGLPGSFAPDVEERVFRAIDLVMKKTGARKSGK